MALRVYQGDDLLEVFKRLNIQTGDINPHVIRAWFDTDCKESKNLLNWMCSSLNEDNYVSPLKSLEYLKIKAPLEEDGLAREVQTLETNYPGLFQYESNLLETEIAEDEIELLEDELNDKKSQLHINEKINKALSAELSLLNADKIKSELKKDDALENCLQLSEKCDELNKELYNQTCTIQQHLHNISQESSEQFVNSINLEELEENFNSVVLYLSNILHIDDFLQNSNNKSLSALPDIKNRLFRSMKACLSSKMEIEKLEGTRIYLKNYNIKFFDSFDRDFCEMKINSKKQQHSFQFEILEQLQSALANNYINRIEQQVAEQKSKKLEEKLSNLRKIDGSILQLLAHIEVMKTVNSQEVSDFDNVDKFFINAHKLSKGLEKCEFRTQIMSDIIKEYEEYNAGEFQNKFPLIGTFGKILGHKTTVVDTLTEITSLRHDISSMESKLFCPNNIISRNIGQELLDNIKNLQNFLICGPTCQIVSIPENLHKAIIEADLVMEKQSLALHEGIQINKTTLKGLSEDKYVRDRRCLWMYFVSNPPKLLSLIEKAEDDYKKQLKTDI